MWKSHTIDAKAHNIFDDLVYEHSQKLQNEFYFILSIKTFSNISFSVKSIFRFIFTFIHTRNLRIFRRIYFDQYNYFFLLWMNILQWNDTQITDRKTKCKKHRVINSNFLLFCIEFTTYEQHIKKISHSKMNIIIHTLSLS